MKNLFFFFVLLASSSVFGQATGKIDYKHLGLSFTIPDGWIGQEAQMGYVMGSNSIPGIILLLPHDQQYTLDQIKEQARAGLSEGNATDLRLSGELAELGNGAVGADFAGTLEGQQAKAYIIGMSNPHGLGLSIAAITTSEHYNANYAEYAKAVRNSVQFRKPEAKEDINEWKQWMKNVKLTYRDSYTSISPGTDGMTGGGYNFKKEIDLCGSGYFIYYSYSNVSTGSDNSSAYSNGRDNGSGTWDIIVGADGSPVLQLKFNNGETASYTLSYQDKKLYLNGTRYFRITEGEYTPSCN